MAAPAAPVDDKTADIPDLDAQNQLLYSYGYGFPGYAYAPAAYSAAYHVPVAGKSQTLL